jgi:acetyltransferase EpsM
MNNDRIIIIGAGGLGRVMLDFFVAHGYDVFSFYDDNPIYVNEKLCGIPVIDYNFLLEMKKEGLLFALAILDPKDRENVVSKLSSSKIPFLNFQAATSFLSPHTSLGVGYSVLDYSFIMNGARLDEYVHVHFYSAIGHDAIVGPYTTFGPNCIIGGYAKIGKGVKIGMGVRVLPKVNIGDYATVGAGAVVTKSIPAGEVWGGVPAKMIKQKLF